MGSGIYKLMFLSITDFRKDASIRGMVAANGIYNQQMFINNNLLLSQNWDYSKIERDSNNFWFIPYSIQDKMKTESGLNIDTNTFGIVGGTDLTPINTKVLSTTAYFGYNQTDQNYDYGTNKITSGYAGALNKWTSAGIRFASNIYAGFYNTDMEFDNMKESHTNWFWGTGLKTSYQIGLTKNFSISPIAGINYMSIAEYEWFSDYEGALIKDEMIDGLNLLGGLSFEYHTKIFRTYLTTQYGYNNASSSAKVDKLELEQIKVDENYMDYTAGLSINMTKKFSFDARANMKSGEKQSYNYSVGFNYKF